MRFYRCVRGLFLVLGAALFRFRVEGRERIPMEGPAILVAPHRSWLDPACVGAACPRLVRFLILDRVYHQWWGRWFFRRMRTLPVGSKPSESVAALRRALNWLAQGQVLGVFPEGRVISPGVRAHMHPGAALLAVRSGAPVIPLVIHGSARAWPHGKYCPRPASVRVCIGVPIFPPAEHGRDVTERFVEQVEARLREMEALTQDTR